MQVVLLVVAGICGATGTSHALMSHAANDQQGVIGGSLLAMASIVAASLVITLG